ncbi:cupin domain-containing protein [Mesorhizobium sp. CA8]|uniref:cupin domain-containing protein n=1 Tax=Mesorhizobium sp. CA8 TaxID=2876637 RepID=UPI001CCDA77F|nr:cupin domain-containing protein [Mesorhizobium sp. CA8]MBZ9764314.1 cupin domain-containing protein [Mesorhizobium sp. CA8]
MSTAPAVPYWHLWTDADGISHQSRCAMTEFDLESIKPPAEPQWQGWRASGRMTVLLTVLPVGWIGTWHENPKPQWIVPLSGRWFVESMDGARVEMGPGELSFGGDQNCRQTDGKRGHRSGTVGDEPAALIVIQLEDAPTQSLACEFR